MIQQCMMNVSDWVLIVVKMDEHELDQLYFELEEIEAILGVFASIEHDLYPQYIGIVANQYHSKIINIRKRIKSKLEKLIPLAK